MLRKYKAVRFRKDSLERIDQCNAIILDYQSQNLRLTLRQLYYQLVTRNIIPNVEKSYKNLSNLVSDARLAGLMDWEAIEDRVRVPCTPSDWSNIQELVETALRSYRLPRWRGQSTYVELWVEKDALAGVLQPLASEYHITMMVNRGFSSTSAMYESARRYIEFHHGLSPVLLYLGDHDPSGEDMVRDIRDRLEMFGVYGIQVDKIALTMAQVGEYNPPPNPAKVSDPRARKYIDKHGASSWEVDALPPEVLAQIIRKAILTYVDMDKMHEVMDQEEQDKDKLRLAVESIELDEDRGRS